MAPKMVTVRARVLGTVTTAGEPFLDQAMLPFTLTRKAYSSRKTQLVLESKSLPSHLPAATELCWDRHLSSIKDHPRLISAVACPVISCRKENRSIFLAHKSQCLNQNELLLVSGRQYTERLWLTVYLVNLTNTEKKGREGKEKLIEEVS